MPLQRRVQQGVHLSEIRAKARLFTTSGQWALQGNAVARRKALSSLSRSAIHRANQLHPQLLVPCVPCFR